MKLVILLILSVGLVTALGLGSAYAQNDEIEKVNFSTPEPIEPTAPTAPTAPGPVQEPTPESTAPESTAPESTAPESTAPESTAPESTAPDPVQEPTPEPIDNDVKCGIGTESVNGICVVIQTQEPGTNDDIFTKFYRLITSLFD